MSKEVLDSVDEDKFFHRHQLTSDEGYIPGLATEIQETDAAESDAE